MNLANTAPVRTPWMGLGPEGIPAFLLNGGGLSLQLSFDLAAPAPAPALAPLASPWMPEARDTSRHGAELAALLVMLQPEAELVPLARKNGPTSAMIPPPEGSALLPGPQAMKIEALEIDALAAAPIPPAPDWLFL